MALVDIRVGERRMEQGTSREGERGPQKDVKNACFLISQFHLEKAVVCQSFWEGKTGVVIWGKK